MGALASYPVLICCFAGWLISSLLKIPVYYILHRKLNFALAFGTGGMPSSHSATMTATTLAIGLFGGFDQPLFALAIAVSMIVIYDAAGVRREAGFHAEALNKLVDEWFVISKTPIGGSEAPEGDAWSHSHRSGGGSVSGVAFNADHLAFLA